MAETENGLAPKKRSCRLALADRLHMEWRQTTLAIKTIAKLLYLDNKQSATTRLHHWIKQELSQKQKIEPRKKTAYVIYAPIWRFHFVSVTRSEFY